MTTDHQAYHKERHTGNLSKPLERNLFVGRVAAGMEQASKVLLDTAERLRSDPEGMLAHVFKPNLIGMLPSVTAMIEVQWHAEPQVKKPFMSITGKTIVDGSKINEIGVRAIWQDGTIKPVEDLHQF